MTRLMASIMLHFHWPFLLLQIDQIAAEERSDQGAHTEPAAYGADYPPEKVEYILCFSS